MPSPAQLEKLCAVFDCRLTQLLFGQDGADADAMLMQLMKRLYSLRALLVAAAGALLILLPTGPQYTAATSVGLFFTGLLSGIHIGCTIVGVFVLFYGLSPLSPRPELSGRTAGIWCCFSIPAMIESV